MQHQDQCANSQPTVVLPEALDSLARFLQVATALGTQIAFWRSNGRLEKLHQASAELHSILLSPGVFEMPELARSAALATFESLLERLAALKQAVPFESKVGIVRQSLVPCFQEIFILHQLTLSVIARLRLHDETGGLRPSNLENLISEDEKRGLQQTLAAAMPFWRKEEWNVYDHL